MIYMMIIIAILLVVLIIQLKDLYSEVQSTARSIRSTLNQPENPIKIQLVEIRESIEAWSGYLADELRYRNDRRDRIYRELNSPDFPAYKSQINIDAGRDYSSDLYLMRQSLANIERLLKNVRL